MEATGAVYGNTSREGYFSMTPGRVFVEASAHRSGSRPRIRLGLRQGVETTSSAVLYPGKAPSDLPFEPRGPRYGPITVLAYNEPKMGFKVGKMAQNGRNWPMVRPMLGPPERDQMNRREPKLVSRGVRWPF